MGLNEGRAWVSLGGVGHVEMSEGFFGLTGIYRRGAPISLTGYRGGDVTT